MIQEIEQVHVEVSKIIEDSIVVKIVDDLLYIFLFFFLLNLCYIINYD